MNKTIALILSLLIASSITVPSISYADSQTGVSVNVNGQRIYPDSSAYIKDGRTLIPLRGVFEKLGATVNWISDQQKVVINYHSKTINLQINNTQADVNGTQIQIDVPPVIDNNRTMVPLRFISENMGMWVQWVPEAHLATITDPSYFSTNSGTTTLGYTTNDYKGDDASYNSLVTNSSNINSIATFSYQFDTNGNLTLTGQSQQNTVEFANSNNIRPLLLIHNLLDGKFDRNLAHTVLSDASIRSKLIDNTILAMSKEEYSGVNIDIENVFWYDRDNYSAFIRELKQKLTPYGFLTTVSVPAKTFDSYNNDSWGGAFDYAAIGQNTDKIMIMTYDEHYFGGSGGPIASLPWVEKVIKYAVQTMPSNKILLGIAGYGYDWSDSGNKAIQYKNISALLSGLNIQSSWDDYAKSPYFIYDDKGTIHQVWYEDSRSIASKLSLVKTYSLGGIGIWRLGYDNDEFWSTIKAGLNPA